MMKKKEASASWLVIKVVVMVIALIGIFWARSALQEKAQPGSPDQPPIPAKVQFGK